MTPKWAGFFLVCLALGGCSRSAQDYIAEGNRQFEAGKLQDAELLYRKALQKEANSGEAHYRLALAALKQNKGVEAFQLLNRAIELQPDNKEAFARLGEIALAVYMADTRRPETMHATLQRATKRLLELEPEGYDGNRFAGFLALMDAQPTEAVKLFRKAEKVKPDEPELRLTIAQALIQAGEPEEGEALARSLTDTHPDFSAAYEMLYRRYAAQRRLADAEAVLRKRVEKNPSNAGYAVSLAAHYAAANQKAQAGELLERLASDAQRYPDGLVAAGDYEVRRGDYNAALAYYAKGMERAGAHQLASRKRYAGTLVLAGRRQEAAELLGKLAKEAPQDREVRSSRAYLLLESGTAEGTKQAMAELQALIQEKDDQAALHYHLGRGLLAGGDREGARKEWLNAVRLDALDVRPRLALARLALNTGDAAGALRQTEELLQTFTGHPELELIRAGALRAEGRYNEARTALEALRKRYPANPAVELERASLALSQGAYAEAERGFRGLYRPGGAETGAMMGLAQTLVAMGKRPEALRLLEDDLKAAPGRVPVQMALAEGYLANGEAAKAAALLEQVIRAEPRAAPAYALLAGLRVREERLGEAAKLLQNAAENSPGEPDVLTLWGEVEHAQANFAEAEKRFREAVAAAPESRRARIGLALALAEAGVKLEEAMEQAQRALKAAPADLAARDAVAYVYLKQKRTAEALPTLRALAQQSPKQALFRYHYGLALAESGDAAQAKAEFESALAQNPPAFLAKRIRAAQR